jgi:hypothetical protein
MASLVNQAGKDSLLLNPAMHRWARENADFLLCVETLARQFALLSTNGSLHLNHAELKNLAAKTHPSPEY